MSELLPGEYDFDYYSSTTTEVDGEVISVEDTEDKEENSVKKRDPQYLYYPIEMKGNYLDWPGTITFKASRLDNSTNVSGALYDIIDAVENKITETFIKGGSDDRANDLLESEENVIGINSDQSERENSTQTENISYTQKAIKAVESTFSDVADWYNEDESLKSFRDNNLFDGDEMGFVRLPLRQQLQFTDRLSYNQNAELGMIGGAVESGIANGKSAIGSAAKSIIKAGEGFLTGKSSPAVSSLVIKGLQEAGIFFPQNATQAVSSATRIATNPNTRALFENAQIRNFSFSFVLIAKNPREAREITNIIKFFRMSAYPETIKLGGIPVGYIFPDIFHIEVEYKGKRIATKILPTYLTSVDVVYNEPTTGMHSDGNFVQTNINLTFVEAHALNRARIEKGY